MSLAAGTPLGPYVIVAPIGAGGMGEVYRARDTRLDRLVALKVAKAAFDERFAREARAVAALSHPHICALYDVGPNYLVMELVDGVPLAGPLPVAQAVDYAAQILDALDAAHKKGITHRDLKPANILVTKHGIKLLDFGLAKQTQGPLADGAPTMSALTTAGQIVGTLQYMAPEQLQGQPVDARADLFAFGCVLYELLSGTRAFDGSSPASVIAAILERQPAPLTLHPPLDRVIATCLAKDPDDRFQTALDTKRAMRWAMEQPTASASIATPASRLRERVLMACAATALVGLAVVSYLWYPRPTPLPEPIAFTIAPPPDQQLIGASYLSVSPDGRHIAYVTGNGNELWVRSVGSIASRRLDRADSPWGPTWSPDSRTIAFTSRPGTRGLRTVDVASGQVSTVVPDASGSRPAWSKHGVILFQGAAGNGSKLYQVPEAGGTPVVAMEADASRQEVSLSRPEFLPDGRRYLFLAYYADSAKTALFLASLDTPGRTFLLNIRSNVAYARGHLFYHRDGTLMAHPFDADAGRLTGEPTPIVENVQYNLNGMGAFSVSESGVLAFVTGDLSTETNRLVVTNRAGASPRQIGEVGRYLTANLSPDGSQAVIERYRSYRSRENINSRELALLDIDRGVTTRFTTGEDQEFDSVWSPDGSQLVFASIRGGTYGIYRRSAGGAAATDERIYSSSEPVAPVDWSRDGTRLLMVRGLRGLARLWVLPMTGDRTPVEAFPGAPSQHDQSTFSPDGNWIAYTEVEDLESEVYVQPYPADGRRIRISTSTGINPRWTPDGRRIVYRALDGAFHSVDLNPDGRTFRPSAPVRLFSQPPRAPTDHRYGADARLERFLLTLPLDSAGAPATPINVVVNFVQGLRKN